MAPLLWSPYFESSVLSAVQLESVQNEASKLGRLSRGSTWGFWFSFVRPLPVGVVFFPSLHFMGVVLSPSFVLGDVSREGGTLLVSLSLPLFLIHKLFPSLFSSSPLFHLVFLSSFFFEGFFFEGTACTICFRDVRNDTTNCNQLYLYYNKEIFYFLNLEFCAF